jgi:polyisoprenyl-phosphate glycosyltransferase
LVDELSTSLNAGLDVTVVLPALNEVGHIRAEVDRITKALKDSQYSFEILVVDDGSTDGTSDAVDGLPFVRLLRFPVNRGAGTARRIGTMAAHGRWVVWTDADMTYPNERIPELVGILETGRAHQVVGARLSEEGTAKLARVPAKWAVRRIAEYLTRTRIPDLNSGLRAFSRELVRPFLGLLPAGFSCVTTITLAFLANGHAVKYVPVDYFRRAGRSKFHPFRDAYNYIIQVLRMIMYFNPLRVLMPVALALLSATFVKAGVDPAVHDLRVAGSTVLVGLAAFNIMAIALLADLVVRRTATD